MLAPSLAQEVAQETAAVTGLGILITDVRGIVIGSSDLKRVGTFHEASVEVISTASPRRTPRNRHAPSRAFGLA
jgi:carbohydrate diacid regulator